MTDHSPGVPSPSEELRQEIAAALLTANFLRGNEFDAAVLAEKVLPLFEARVAAIEAELALRNMDKRDMDDYDTRWFALHDRAEKAEAELNEARRVQRRSAEAHNEWCGYKFELERAEAELAALQQRVADLTSELDRAYSQRNDVLDSLAAERTQAAAQARHEAAPMAADTEWTLLDDGKHHNRLALAWHVLRGRPLIYRAEVGTIYPRLDAHLIVVDTHIHKPNNHGCVECGRYDTHPIHQATPEPDAAETCCHNGERPCEYPSCTGPVPSSGRATPEETTP